MDFVLERLYQDNKGGPSQRIIFNESGQSYTCGRGKENHIICFSVVVSRKHCIFFHNDDNLYVTDLQSSNGIFINGERQKSYQMIKLHENDIVGIGCPNVNQDNNDKLLYMYKICIMKSSVDEEIENSILSRTLVNNDAVRQTFTTAEHIIEEKSRFSSVNCDTIVPCKIPKYNDNDFDECRISHSREINPPDNQNLHNNNNNNNIINPIETKSEMAIEIDDDIEIIHTSLTNKSTTGFNENCMSEMRKYSNSDKSDFIHHNAQFLTNLSKNCSRKTKISVDRDNDDDDNADSASKLHSTEKVPSNPYKTKDGSYSAKNSNPIDIKDEIIDLGDDLQLTDDDEKAHIVPVSNKMIHEEMPIKLKKVKHEAKTRFSEIDIVDLSDDEAGIFPYSQLFDIKYEDHTESKVEIKQECNDNEDQNNEIIDLNEDDESLRFINLTDDEDEDNPWLERLSRSQLLNEDKKPALAEVKDEIDLGIWENDEISNILQSDVFIYEPDNNEIVFTSHADKIDDTKHTDTLTAKIINPMDASDINHSNEISLKKTDSRENTHMELHIESIELNKSKEPDNLRIESSNITKEPDDLTRKFNYLTGKSNVLLKSVSTESPKSKSVTKCTTSKKSIPIIEAKSLPARKKNRSEHREEKKEKQKRIEEKTQSKLTAEKKSLKIQTLKKQINKNFYGKQCYKEAHSSAIDCSPLSKAKTKTFITKEEKKIIIEKRKVKLKEIAEEKKKLTTKKTVKRGTATPKTKISLTNRGDFLITEKVSKPFLDKSTKPPSTKPSHNQSENLSMKKIDTLKNSSNTKETLQEKQRSYRKQNLSKNMMDNITTTLQQSLYLDNTASSIQVTKENSIQDSKAINKERKHSSSKGKKKHEIVSDHVAKTSELVRSKSIERISILVQKENFAPNSKSAGKSKVMHDRVRSIAELSKQKKVTFSDKVDVKVYEIEAQHFLKKMVGKDAPIPTNKLAKTTSTTCVQWLKLEDFLLRIFMWNPVWLEEQRYLKCMPPIVSTQELQSMKLFYTSYQEYYTIMMPLLLLEIWYIMSKDFNDIEKNMKRVTAICYIVENSITPVSSLNLSMTTLTIEVLVEKQDFNKTHPIYGDLVSLEYGIDVHGKQKFHKIFAYITNVHQRVITDFTNYNKDLRNYVKEPYAVVTYTLLTRLLEHNIAVNRVQRVRTVTYLRASIRMVQALQYLPRSPLLNLLLNPKIEDYQLPLMNETLLISSSKFIEDNLNPRQLEIICRVSEAVLRQESKICLIQGPPGTGKSKVIVNLVSRILYGNSKNQKSLRILVCAPSNAAIDEIVLRLLIARSSFKPKYGGFNIVRIGRLESMHPMARNISVTELARRYITQINQSSKKEEIMDLQTRINSLQNVLVSSRKMDETKRKEIENKLDDTYAKYEIMKFFDGKTWDEFNEKERVKVTCLSQDMILKGANVITCTLSSCYTNQMETIFGNKNRISVCIVDEATQSSEAETLIPLMLDINTLVLVGDPNQLPATILSQQAKKLGLNQSIFSRMQNVFASQSSNPILMLDTQYRMDCAISYWPNRYFYNDRLKNASQVITQFPLYSYIVLNHNAAQNNDKFSNTTEAEFVANIIYVIMAFTKWDNIDEKICIGILTPYNNQRSLIRNKINGKISCLPESIKKKITFEVNTVDSFQGQERDIIIMSCVRSHGIGFLSDRQRLCVALTRAKHSLIMCGNFNTFMKNQMWKTLLFDAKSRGVFWNIDAHATSTQIRPFIIK